MARDARSRHRLYLAVSLLVGAILGHVYLALQPPLRLVRNEFDVPATVAAREMAEVGSDRAAATPASVAPNSDRDSRSDLPPASSSPSTASGTRRNGKEGSADSVVAASLPQPRSVSELLTGQAFADGLLRSHYNLPPPARVEGAGVRDPWGATDHPAALWEEVVRQRAHVRRALGNPPWDATTFHAFGVVEPDQSLVVFGRGEGVPASPAATVGWFQRAFELDGTAEGIHRAEELAATYDVQHEALVCRLVARVLSSDDLVVFEPHAACYFVDDSRILLYDASEVPEVTEVLARHQQRLSALREAVLDEVE